MAEQLEVDVYWSFRSPWSYLATPRLREWQERYLLKVNLRVVYPIAIRTPEFFDQVQPQWFSYFGKDVRRVAEFLNLPFVFPNPDPRHSISGRRRAQAHGTRTTLYSSFVVAWRVS